MPDPRYTSITRRDLELNEHLTVILQQAIARGSWQCRTDRDILEFFALAEKALADDTHETPGRLFRYLVEKRKTDTITNRVEERARRRLAVDGIHNIRIFLAERRPTARAPTAKIGYCPSQLINCPFPPRRLERDVKYWHIPSRHGTVTVSAGHFAAPGIQPVSFEVPHSGSPRLLLPYIVGEAVRKRSRTVHLGKNLHRFLKKLGISAGSKNYRMISTQLLHLGACQITTGQSNISRTHESADISLFTVSEKISYRRAIETVEHMATEDSTRSDPLFWETTFTLSPQFYDYMTANPVPVNLEDLARLIRSPRRMDIYTWLSNRVYHLSGQPASIPIGSLHSQFSPGWHPAHLRQFRHRFEQDIEAVCALHPGFRVSLSKTHMIIHRSTPPVHPQQ